MLVGEGVVGFVLVIVVFVSYVGVKFGLCV